jgi:Zn-dependent protease with chaperone function
MGRTDTFITAMRKLEDLNLAVIDKSSQWTHSHPSTAERIAAAERCAKEHFKSNAVAQGPG